MKSLIYCPLIYRYDEGTWPPTAPATWYFDWQKKLWNYFVNFPDVNVIWKVGHNMIDDPIRNWKAPNIRYSTKSIERELRKADMAFFDYLSTPVWDCIKTATPYLVVIQFDVEYVRDVVFEDVVPLWREDQDDVLALLSLFIKENM